MYVGLGASHRCIQTAQRPTLRNLLRRRWRRRLGSRWRSHQHLEGSRVRRLQQFRITGVYFILNILHSSKKTVCLPKESCLVRWKTTFGKWVKPDRADPVLKSISTELVAEMPLTLSTWTTLMFWKSGIWFSWLTIERRINLWNHCRKSTLIAAWDLND